MFLRSNTRNKDGKQHTYYTVVENRRLSSGKTTQKQLLYLGEINSSQQAAWRKTLEVFDENQDRVTSMSLFADNKPLPADASDGVQIKVGEVKLQRARPYDGGQKSFDFVGYLKRIGAAKIVSGPAADPAKRCTLAIPSHEPQAQGTQRLRRLADHGDQRVCPPDTGLGSSFSRPIRPSGSAESLEKPLKNGPIVEVAQGILRHRRAAVRLGVRGQDMTACGSGCTINVPGISGRAVYYVVDWLDDAGTLVRSGTPGAAVVP